MAASEFCISMSALVNNNNNNNNNNNIFFLKLITNFIKKLT